MTKYKLLISFCLVFVLGLLFLVASAVVIKAACDPTINDCGPTDVPIENRFGGTGNNSSANTAGNTNEGVTLNNPLGPNSSAHPIGDLANRLIKTALGISGVLALLAFVYGGILWMVPFGDQTGNIKKGKQMMVWAVLGLVVIFSSYAVINFIGTALGISQ